MATVVNARDTQILAANPRYLGITMNSNVVVDQSNVSGLGLIVDGTKQIWLASTTQIIKVPKTGLVTPSSITLTANVRNLTATPTISIVAGEMSVTPALTGGVFTYTPAQQTSDILTLRLTLAQDGKTYTDDLTIVKVVEGSDALTGLLTNENFSLPADYLGNVTSYAGCGGNFKVYQGTTDVTSVCTFAIISGGNPDSLTVSLTASGANAGTYAITGGYPVAKDITTLTMRATFGSATIDKVMSIAKAKAGPAGGNGVNATAYWLARSVAAIQKSQAGVYTPESVAFTGYSATGASAPAAYSGRFIIATTTDGTTYTDQYTSSANESSKAYTVPAGIKALRVRLYLGGGTTTLLDEEVIPVVVDGTQGVNGADGAGGVSAVLSNSAHVLPAAADGTVTSYVGSGTTLRVYEGATELNFDGVGASSGSWTFSSVATNITRGALTDSGTYATIGDSSGVAAGTDTASIVYTVSGKNSKGTAFSFDIKQSISKSKQGGNGSNGTNGTNGQRGSRSFYVAIAGSAWSDTTATVAASADGGPVLNDIVCQYNNAANFSQTKFWNGSAWIVINAVVDGNLLVNGTVGAKALTINNGGGNNLWFDPNYSDVSSWKSDLPWGTTPTQATVTDGASGGTTLRSPTGGSASARGAWRVPVTVGKTYRVSVKARKTPTANGSMYVRIDGGTARTGAYGEILIGIEGMTGMSTTAAWTEYAATWVATTPFASVMVLVNHSGTAGYMEAQDIRLEEMMDSALIVSGGITADRIDTRGLTIKDSNGNVILGAGTGLDYSHISANPDWLNSNVTLGSLGYTGALNATYGATAADLAAAAQDAQNRVNAVPIGSNLLPNSEQTTCTWTRAYTPNGATFGQGPRLSRELWSNTYVLPGEGTQSVAINQNGNRTANVDGDNINGNWVAADFFFGDSGGGVRGVGAVAVVPGQRYIASVYAATHRCDLAIFMQILDINGSTIVYGRTNYTFDTDPATDSLGNFTRMAVSATMPANAVAVKMFVRKFDSKSGDSWVWLAAPQIERAGATQTEPGPYSPGPTTSVAQLGYTGDMNATYGAVWNGTISGQPADSTVQNNQIGINSSGQFYGGGAGTGMVVSNNQMAIGADGRLYSAGNYLGSQVTFSGLGGGALGRVDAINSVNVSTYIAGAAINLAQINTASIGSLSALTATIGTLRTATSGGRTEIMDNKIYVYDTTNALRVKLGNLV